MSIFPSILTQKTIPPGHWGGAGVSLEIDKKSARLEFDCANGEIPSVIKTDRKGNFSVAGKWSRETSVMRVDVTPPSDPVRYTGKVTGNAMTLRVTMVSTGEELASFKLTKGASGRLRKCR